MVNKKFLRIDMKTKTVTLREMRVKSERNLQEILKSWNLECPRDWFYVSLKSIKRSDKISFI